MKCEHLKKAFDTQGPVVAMMIGLPGAGKTHFRKKFPAYTKFVSLDDLIHDFAMRFNVTYDQAWNMSVKGFKIDAIMRGVAAQGYNFVIDQTNLTKKSRSRKLDLIKLENPLYRTIGVYINTPPIICAERIMERQEGAGLKVLEDMVETFEPPSPEEFDWYLEYNHDGDLLYGLLPK